MDKNNPNYKLYEASVSASFCMKVFAQTLASPDASEQEVTGAYDDILASIYTWTRLVKENLNAQRNQG